MVQIKDKQLRLFVGDMAAYFCTLEEHIKRAAFRVCIAGWILHPTVRLGDFSFTDLILRKVASMPPDFQVVIVIWSHWYEQRSRDTRKNPHQFIRYFQARWKELYPGRDFPENIHLRSGGPKRNAAFHDKVVVIDNDVFVGSLDLERARREVSFDLFVMDSFESCGENWFSRLDTKRRTPFFEATVMIAECPELANEVCAAILDNVQIDGTDIQVNLPKSAIPTLRLAMGSSVPLVVQPGDYTCQLVRTVAAHGRFEIKNTFIKLVSELGKGEVVVIVQQYFTLPKAMLKHIANQLVKQEAHLVVVLPMVPNGDPFGLDAHTIRYYQSQSMEFMREQMRAAGKNPERHVTFLSLHNWAGQESRCGGYEKTSWWQRWTMQFEKRRHWPLDATVERIIYHPGLSSKVALLRYTEGEQGKRWILAPWGLDVGDELSRSNESNDENLKAGSRRALKEIPVGFSVHNVNSTKLDKLSADWTGVTYSPNRTRQVGYSAKVVQHTSGGKTILFISEERAWFQVDSQVRASMGVLVRACERDVKMADHEQNRKEIYGHAKFVLTLTHFLIGSANTNERSFESDTEANVLITSNGTLPARIWLSCLAQIFGPILTKALTEEGFMTMNCNTPNVVDLIQKHAKDNWKAFLSNESRRDSGVGFITFFPSQKEGGGQSAHLPDVPPELYCPATRIHPTNLPLPTRFLPDALNPFI